MEDRPRNLRSMLAEAKDTSELMVDLAYAAVYFGDPDMAEEVVGLEEDMNDLVHDMRAVSILAVRNPKEAEAMSSVLQVISAIERMGNGAVDIANIVLRRLGIPRQLVADLSEAEEVSHRVKVRSDSEIANRPLSSVELPVATGMRVMAIRRGRAWNVDVGGDDIVLPDDVLIVEGPPAGISPLRELCGAPEWHEPGDHDTTVLTDLDRAVDTLVEMKNISEAAVGLAYSALVFGDPGLAGEVRHLEDRLDTMNDRLELWVLRAGADDIDPSGLRGLLRLATAAEDIGDQAQQMVWLIEHQEDVHPILGIALGDSDEVVMRVPVAAGSRGAGSRLDELGLAIEPGYQVLAIRRGESYLYRPRRHVRMEPGDELIAVGPDEGREALAALFGWGLTLDEETGEVELTAV